MPPYMPTPTRCITQLGTVASIGYAPCALTSWGSYVVIGGVDEVAPSLSTKSVHKVM